MVRVTKAIARKILADVPDEKQFWLADGRYLKNLAELEAALAEISPDLYRVHAGGGKTDFSNWVRDVMGDDELAADLLKCAAPEQAVRAVAGRFNYLKRLAA